jgi:hypothetical protein
MRSSTIPTATTSRPSTTTTKRAASAGRRTIAADDNIQIADRVEAFGSLLELAEDQLADRASQTASAHFGLATGAPIQAANAAGAEPARGGG